MILRTSLLLASCCLALLRGALCSPDDGPCEYVEILLQPDSPTPANVAIAEEIAALEGPFAGTWRWHSSTDELEIEGGGVEFFAQAAFVPDPTSYRMREHVGGGAGAACGEGGLAVDGVFTITDQDGAVVVSLPIEVERLDGKSARYAAWISVSPITEVSTRLHENAEYDVSEIVGSIAWIEGEGVRVELAYRGQIRVGESVSSGVTVGVADFE